MPRETAKARRARIADLLAAYDESARQLRKLERDVKAMAEEIREAGPGTYSDWTYSHGTPREILDQPAAQALIRQLGGEVPKITTKPPIVVTHVAATR